MKIQTIHPRVAVEEVSGLATPLPWFAVRTRSNFERVSCASLSQKGYETLLPLYRTRRLRWKSKCEVELPLFPGYLFCRFDFQRRLPVLISPGVVHIVGGAGAPEPVPESEISAVRAVVAAHLGAMPWPFLRVGQWVRMMDGPLAGIEGHLVEVKGRLRLVVSITMLQRSIAAEVDARWVRPVKRSAAEWTEAGVSCVGA